MEHWLLLLCGDASAPFTGFLSLRLALTAKKGLKREAMNYLVVDICETGFVCHLRGVLLPCIHGQVSVR